MNKVFNKDKMFFINTNCEFIKFQKVKNDPGTLSSSTINAFKKILPQIVNPPVNRQKAIIQIKGEEDLLVLPAVLLSPLKTLIFYGQPNKGLVQIKVTEEMKKKVLDLLTDLNSFLAKVNPQTFLKPFLFKT